MEQRRGHRGAACAVLERARAPWPIALEVRADAGEQRGERLAGAVGRQQRRRAGAVGGDPAPARRGRAQRRAPRPRPRRRLRRRRSAASAQCSATSAWPCASCVPAAASAEQRMGGDLGGVREAAEARARPRRAHPRSTASARRSTRARRRESGSAGGERVAERPLAVARARVPGARAPVQRGLERGIRAVQLGAQHLAEQAMMAEALGGAVERHEREAGAREPRQHGGRARPLRARSSHSGAVSTSSTEVRADEPPLLVGQLGEHLVADVLGDTTRSAPPKRASPTRGAPCSAERQRGQRKPGRPALGAAHERVEVSAGRSCTPPPRSIAAASARVIASSPARNSTSRPCMRRRVTGSGGSAREASATVTPGGGCVASEAITSRAGGGAQDVARRRAPARRGRLRHLPWRRPARARSSAAACPGRRAGDGASPSANGRGSCAHQSHNSVVLPYPAGATTTTNGGASGGQQRRQQARTADTRRAAADAGRRTRLRARDDRQQGRAPSSDRPASTAPPGRGKGAHPATAGGACTRRSRVRTPHPKRMIRLDVASAHR